MRFSRFYFFSGVCLRGFRFYFVSFFAVAPLLFLFWRRSAPSKDRNTSVLAYKQNKKNGAKAKTTERIWQWNQTKRHIYIFIFIYTNSTKCIHEKNQEHYYRWIAVGGPTTDGHPSSWFAERDRARQSETDPRQTRDRARQPPRVAKNPRVLRCFVLFPFFAIFRLLCFRMGQHRPT